MGTTAGDAAASALVAGHEALVYMQRLPQVVCIVVVLVTQVMQSTLTLPGATKMPLCIRCFT